MALSVGNNKIHPISSNFAFLQEHDPLFIQLAVAAEQSFVSDPNTTLIKLRQLGEALCLICACDY